MSTARSSPPSRPDVRQQVQQAIEAQVGALTCQVIDLTMRLRDANDEIDRLQRLAAEAREPPE
jgi:hypothetical protein